MILPLKKACSALQNLRLKLWKINALSEVTKPGRNVQVLHNDIYLFTVSLNSFLQSLYFFRINVPLWFVVREPSPPLTIIVIKRKKYLWTFQSQTLLSDIIHLNFHPTEGQIEPSDIFFSFMICSHTTIINFNWSPEGRKEIE